MTVRVRSQVSHMVLKGLPGVILKCRAISKPRSPAGTVKKQKLKESIAFLNTNNEEVGFEIKNNIIYLAFPKEKT